MAYSTNSDISAEFKGVTFGTSTNPTATQVDTFIADADAEIDARVGMKYTTPIVATASIPIVRRISVLLVTGRIKRILEVKDVNPSLGKQDVQPPDLEKRARDLLKEIVMGTLPLPGATLAVAGDGVASSNVAAGREHFFTMDEDQW